MTIRVTIVVASATGKTERMAQAVADGAREAGAEVVSRSAEDAQPEDLLEADAIILGSGVHMGGIESSMRAFCERMSSLWLQGSLIGKLGAAFVSAGLGARGGAELALISLHANLAEHGMLLVSMPSRVESFTEGGSHWGPVARTTPRGGEAGPTSAQLAAARAHGKHVAQCAERWKSES